ALSHSSRVMMSSILPVVFFTHCRCGPELRPFLMFLPGPVLSEYLANTGVPSRSVSQCWNSPSGFWWRHESRLLVFKGEGSSAVVGVSPVFDVVQGVDDGEWYAVVGALCAVAVEVVRVLPMWAEFLRCCHRALSPLCSRGRMVEFRCG